MMFSMLSMLPPGEIPRSGIETAVGTIMFILVFVTPILLMLVSIFAGAYIERAHYRSIHERETQTADLPAVPTRTLDDQFKVKHATLVTASVVVSLNHFKRFLASIRNIFGGRIRSYESLVDRARREAILRIKEQAVGAHIIVNLRLQTSTVAVSEGKQKVGGIEVLAYGTAVWYETLSVPPDAICPT